MCIAIVFLANCSNRKVKKSDSNINNSAEKTIYNNSTVIRNLEDSLLYIDSEQKKTKQFDINGDTIYESGLDSIPLIHNITISFEDNIIFYDSTLYFYANDIKHLTYNDVNYFLLDILDPIAENTLFVIRYKKNEYISIDRLCGQYIIDIDNDSIVEIIGQEYTDAVCVDCDSCYYSPILVYKLMNKCTLDSIMSESFNIMKYGCFLGLVPKDTIIVCKNMDTIISYISSQTSEIVPEYKL